VTDFPEDDPRHFLPIILLYARTRVKHRGLSSALSSALEMRKELTTTVDACMHVFNLYKCRMRLRDWSLTLLFLCSTPDEKTE
jgi:hypothetical protein